MLTVIPRKAKLFQRYIEDDRDRIELYFLPPYAPELNPDELLWAHVKTRIGKKTVETKIQMKEMIQSALHRLQKLPEIVATFFMRQLADTPLCETSLMECLISINRSAVAFTYHRRRNLNRLKY